jgi:hypothetical protein
MSPTPCQGGASYGAPSPGRRSTSKFPWTWTPLDRRLPGSGHPATRAPAAALTVAAAEGKAGRERELRRLKGQIEESSAPEAETS